MPPTTPSLLHAWIRDHLHLSLPLAPLIPGHTAPFAYLVHTFFEGRFVPAPSGGFAPADPANPPPADCVVWANRGGGKTFLGALATLLDLLFKPGIEVRVLGGSLDQSKRMHTYLRRLLDPARFPQVAALARATITDRRIRLANGSEAEVLAQSETSVRGTRVQKLRCDEADLFRHGIWEAAQLVTRSATLEGLHVRGSIDCLSTMHRPHGLMHDLVADARTGNRALFKWGVVDVLEHCPDSRHCNGAPSHGDRPARALLPQGGGGEPSNRRGLHTPPSSPSLSTPDPTSAPCSSPHSVSPSLPFFPTSPPPCPLLPECAGRAKHRDTRGHISIDDAIRMKSRVSLAAWESEMLCLRPRRSDAVFPEFDPARHVVRDDPPAGLLLCGMDFGFRAPTIVLWAVHADDGTLTVIDERSERGTLLADHAAALLEGRGRRGLPHGPCAWLGADPAGRNRHEQTGESNIDALRRAGLRVRARSLSVKRGLELVRARLRPATPDSPPRLFVHERCTTLIESLERYHFDPARPDREEPVKDGFDHAPDALRYLVQNLDKPAVQTKGTYI